MAVAMEIADFGRHGNSDSNDAVSPLLTNPILLLPSLPLLTTTHTTTTTTATTSTVTTTTTTATGANQG